jgi:transposase
MKLTKAQYDTVSESFPTQRGNVSLSNLEALNAILYVLENGCKWRVLPPYFGNWHTIYTRMSRWTKSGVLNTVFIRLQQKQIITIKIDVVSLDSTNIKVHPDGTGALKNSGNNPSDSLAEDVTPGFIWLPQMTGLQ